MKNKWLPVVLCLGSCSDGPQETGLDRVRVGWQTTWATQGQLAQVLARTDVARRQGLEVELVGFTYGGPLNEGALAGEVDVVLTADQPALSLCARAPNWGIVGRLMYNRVGTFVPVSSPVQDLAGLKGATVGVPVGAAAQRKTLEALGRAGLDPEREVRVVNLGLAEQVALVNAGPRDGRWGEIDAGSAWDPVLADLEHGDRVRVLDTAVVTAVVLMDDAFLSAHPGAEGRFLAALEEGWRYLASHREEADGWFLDAAGVRFDPAVLATAAAVEPNVTGEPRVRLSGEDLAGIRGAADFMLTSGLLKKPVDVDACVRTGARAP